MSQIERKVELLSPAGTLKSQHYAMAFGADAVYAGLPRYSLRVRNNDFNIDNLSVGIDAAQRPEETDHGFTVAEVRQIESIESIIRRVTCL